MAQRALRDERRRQHDPHVWGDVRRGSHNPVFDASNPGVLVDAARFGWHLFLVTSRVYALLTRLFLPQQHLLCSPRLPWRPISQPCRH